MTEYKAAFKCKAPLVMNHSYTFLAFELFFLSASKTMDDLVNAEISVSPKLIRGEKLVIFT